MTLVYLHRRYPCSSVAPWGAAPSSISGQSAPWQLVKLGARDECTISLARGGHQERGHEGGGAGIVCSTRQTSLSSGSRLSATKSGRAASTGCNPMRLCQNT